ncbi:hypothetical protein Fot_35123 [Forsythia ovata]|uniref:Uncharacterized protein n=1 Tax=Forsythia ovata TaxID=205694 RepID=A0ABD1SKL7_9LAMI
MSIEQVFRNVRPSTKRKPNVESRELGVPDVHVSSLLAGVSISTLGPTKTKLDPSVVEKLPPAVALAATSVHKYWTSSFEKATDTAGSDGVDEAGRNTIQKAYVVAQKKAESQLKSCQSMIQARDKELTEVFNELTKAKGLLAKLGVPSYTET